MAAETTKKPDGLAEFWTELQAILARLPNKGLFAGLLAVWLVMFQFLGNSTFGYFDTPSLLEWLYRAYNTEGSEDGHGNLIPAVVLGLMWWKRKELIALPFRVWWPGLLVLAVAMVLHMAGYLVQQPLISAAALFLGGYGLIGLAWGPALMRGVFFPYLLFVFCIPMGNRIQAVSFPLRLLATKIAVGVSHGLLDISVVRDGTRMLDLQGRYRFEVDAACSGVRSLQAIIVFGIIYAMVSFKSPWRRAAIMISAVPFAIFGNVVRLMGIVIAAEIGGQSAGNYVHDSSWLSLLPYIPAFVGIMGLGYFLREKPVEAKPQSGILDSQPVS